MNTPLIMPQVSFENVITFNMVSPMARVLLKSGTDPLARTNMSGFPATILRVIHHSCGVTSSLTSTSAPRMSTF